MSLWKNEQIIDAYKSFFIEFTAYIYNLQALHSSKPNQYATISSMYDYSSTEKPMNDVLEHETETLRGIKIKTDTHIIHDVRKITWLPTHYQAL